MSKSLIDAFRALFQSLDFGKAWASRRSNVIVNGISFVLGEEPVTRPITSVERSSIEPASAELVEKVFRELDNPSPAFLDDPAQE